MEDKAEKSFKDAPSGTSLEAHWLQILTFTGKGAASIPGLCNVANKQIKTVKCLLAQKKSCFSKNPVKTL